jgi:LCP family protein required for cell wall assembly
MSGNDERRLPARLDPRLGLVTPPPKRRKPSPVVALARVIAAVLGLLLLAGSGWGWYLAKVAEASVSRTDAIPGSGNSDRSGGWHTGAEMNLLLVGKDSREGLTAQQQAEYSTGDPDGVLNTDSMILVHLPGDGSGAAFVSLPRDTYVEIPGYGEAKLNSAYAHGYNDAEGTVEERDAAGAQLLVQTVSRFTGLQIDHFAEIDLLGFINLSTIVGGVEVNLCQATSDPMSGADFPAGVQTLSGADALAFVRQRHGLPRFDLDRVVRQQAYIAGLLRNVLDSDLLLDPSRQQAVVEEVGSTLTLDEGLDLFDLAAQMQDVRPDSITFQTIPGLTDANIDGNAVLLPPSEDVVTDFFASLTSTPPASTEPSTPAAPSTSAPTVRPAEVAVSVLNGSGVHRAAADAATALATAGFLAASGGNADPTETTTVRHPTGSEAAAALVAAQVAGAAVVVDDTLPAGTVQLVIGADYHGIGQPVTTQAPAPDDGSYATQERTATDTSCIY